MEWDEVDGERKFDGGRKLMMLQHGMRTYMSVGRRVIRLMKCDEVGDG
jgi:hypothetical protein